MKIAVLGAGMVGRAIALDLVKDHQVSSFDISQSNLDLLSSYRTAVQLNQADLSLVSDYPGWLSAFDLVVTAVPGFMGYATLEAVIKSGKNVVDISFFPENALELDHLAIQNNCTVITDCGVAPGMSNFIIGRYNSEMDIASISCYVGGLPKNKIPPFEYKAPFSPVDVIQEYIRPARLKENGVIVTKPAMSEIENLTFDGVGTLEAFNTDGLRSLLFTMSHIPDMKEKTLRYPGHAKLITDLQNAGFFSETPMIVNGQSIKPLDFTSQLLIDQWKLHPGEEELTVMRVTLKGKNNTIEYELLDHYDTRTGLSSMARTTGFTCTAAVNLITKGLFDRKGVFPPELIGKDRECFDFVIDYLKERGVNWRRTNR
ncbi:saccharopine dehydrogenase NADP-binding domain-containing protein [Terrimonas sp. NA20]|uniref:Saccharopine dehydrogenase NADP-binding domain-containing protein n=1 Tax=Terrimonas ginsenosidimutans TaxID=2908004 RepID=A0ABS9KL51_9BACT|nr:saccharopine dehydrogenase C-terminal domain-containing protein [Terrimonas ginsenosidimutans]MCG2613039.1 saccharopine dehydrogenase NADP-binding domain-containing protein [Terrimonas ginsenosidimutans]